MAEKKTAVPEKFEEAFGRLEEIVAKLESGDVALEESVDLYTEGMTLVKFCNSKLTVAREKIEKLSAKDPGDESGENA
jgi:exodeoxyribonuclease VII small subunit